MSGGWRNQSENLSSCETFRVDSRKWMKHSDLNVARHDHAMQFLGGKFILVF